MGEFAAGNRPVQQIEIQILCAQTSEACLTGTGDAITGYFIALDLGDQEYALALSGNRMTNELLGAAVAVVARGVDQRHAQRNARAQRLFFDSRRVSSLTEVPAALTQCRDDGAVRECDGPRRILRVFPSCRIGGSGRTRRHGTDGRQRQAESRTTRRKLTSAQQGLVHRWISLCRRIVVKT